MCCLSLGSYNDKLFWLFKSFYMPNSLLSKMDKLRKLFTENLKPRQKQYEALRMLAFEHKSCEEVAKYFGYTVQTVRNLKNSALRGKIDFFDDIPTGPKKLQTPPHMIQRIVELRYDNLSVYDIQKILQEENEEISTRTIERILYKEGFSKLSRRTKIERHITRRNTIISERAKNLDIEKLLPFKIDCPIAGVFSFIPYIIESGIIDIVQNCKLPESSDIGKTRAALSMLLLKLIGNKRLSHIQYYDQEPSFGIFSGLNTLPKSTFMTTYSCRTSDFLLQDLQKQVISHFIKIYPNFYQSNCINLDFHSIPHFGTKSQMEKVWCGARSKALKGANTLLAQDGKSDVIIYTKTDILRKNESQEIKNFVAYWLAIRGIVEETLVFDCRLTTYEVLCELDSFEPKIQFITLRKRHKKLLEDTEKIPLEKWQQIFLSIPKRLHKKVFVYEEEVNFKNCQNSFRQIIVKGHGRNKPTFIITNNRQLTLTKVLEVYAKRWHIENKIGEMVSFFNLNALSSPLMIRIHFDIFWTLIADTLYHRLAQDLPRFENCQADVIFNKFINFPGVLKFDGKEFVIKIRKRAHTPLLLSVDKLIKPVQVPWLNNMPLKIIWTA